MVDKTNPGHTGAMPFLSRSTLEPFPWLERMLSPVGVDTRKRALAWILVFSSYLLTAQIGVYLYRDIGTSPALIWPPVGIALAAVLIEGYWILSAVAVAALVNSLLTTVPVPGFIMFGSVLANTIQPLVGGYILRRLRFNPLMNSIRDVFLLVSVAGTATAIMPLMNYGFAMSYNFIFDAARTLPPWPNLWLGGALSALVLTPFLARWVGTDISDRTRLQQLEALFSTLSVIILSYLIFATPLVPSVSTTVLLLLIGALFWVAFRTGPRMMTLALLSMTSISLAGAIYGIHAPPASGVEPSLSQRLISTQMFDLIFCFFFFVLVSVEEQRKDAIKTISKEAERLEHALQTIRAEDTAKNEFIATLAHELRNPLAPVISGLELLLLDESKAERIEVLRSAQRQSLVMRRLLDELLDVARITRRSFTLHPEEVTLQSVLQQSVQGVEHFYKERGQKFEQHVPPNDLWVRGDPVRLTQIFTNILYNAGKYTDPHGAITLSLSRSGEKAVIAITDTGVGIDESMFSRIFEPFVQSHPSSPVGTGLGIGLSIAKRLVDLHDGSIRAESAGRNKGSTFIVELPLVQNAASEKEIGVNTGSAPTSILVVDDNLDAAESMARLLRTRGHTINVAYSGKDALSALAKKPTVVLLDIGLPDMDGLTVAREIRAKEPRTAIIALSGYGSERDKERATSAGINTHLTKPASLSDIEAALSRLVRN
jgi:signal transduction histidine kinase/CheY-like chemotaxis protein